MKMPKIRCFCGLEKKVFYSVFFLFYFVTLPSPQYAWTVEEVLHQKAVQLPEIPVSPLKEAEKPSQTSGIYPSKKPITSTDFMMGEGPLSGPAKPGGLLLDETSMKIFDTGDEFNGTQRNITVFPDKSKEVFDGVWSNTNPGFDEQASGEREVREKWESTEYDAQGKVQSHFTFEDKVIDRKRSEEIVYHEYSYWVDGVRQYIEKSGNEKDHADRTTLTYDWIQVAGSPRRGYEYQIHSMDAFNGESIYTRWLGEEGWYVVQQVWQEEAESVSDPQKEFGQLKVTMMVYNNDNILQAKREQVNLVPLESISRMAWLTPDSLDILDSENRL